MNRRASCVGTFEVFEAAHVALRTLLAFSQPVNCIFWPIGMLNWLVAASKLHKHRETCCTAEWSFYSFLILCLKGEDRFPAGQRALLRWFQSGRNRWGRMKKVWLFSNWHGGVRSPKGQWSIPSWAKSTFKLVSEWKKKDSEVVTVLGNLTSSC